MTAHTVICFDRLFHDAVFPHQSVCVDCRFRTDFQGFPNKLFGIFADAYFIDFGGLGLAG